MDYFLLIVSFLSVPVLLFAAVGAARGTYKPDRFELTMLILTSLFYMLTIFLDTLPKVF